MATLPNTSIGYDQQVIFQPNENVSAVDASNIAFFSWQTLKNFVNVFVSPTACRAAGFVPTFLGNSTPSPSIQLSGPGLVLVSLPQPWSTNDPNSYSGALFYIPAGFASIGITPPGSGSRTDSLDLIYTEQNGASTGIAQHDLRDQIETNGTILLNQPFYTRSISSYQISYIQNSDVTPPVAGAIRLMTLTVSSSGTCAQTFLLPSIWENQAWPTGSPNTAEQSQSLYDNMASLRYQINAIIGQTNWYNQPYLSLAQLGNAPQYWGGTDTSGAANTITLSIPHFQTPVKAGTAIKFIVNNANTGATQVNINALGGVSVFTPAGTALPSGYFVSGNLYEVVYNGSNYLTVNTADGQIAKTYWGGTAGAPNAVSLTITGYPTVVPIGTVIEFVSNSSSNSSSMTMSINGSSPLALNNASNGGFVGGELVANTLYYAIYNGSNYQVLNVFATPAPWGSNMQVYNTNGSYNFTVPAGTFFLKAKAWGAGGGSPDSGNHSCGGGGGYCEGTFNVTPFSTISLVIGQGGGTGHGNGGNTTIPAFGMTANGGGNHGGGSTGRAGGGGASGGSLQVSGSDGFSNDNYSVGGGTYAGAPQQPGDTGSGTNGKWPGGGSAGTGAGGGDGFGADGGVIFIW